MFPKRKWHHTSVSHYEARASRRELSLLLPSVATAAMLLTLTRCLVLRMSGRRGREALFCLRTLSEGVDITCVCVSVCMCAHVCVCVYVCVRVFVCLFV